MIQENNVFEIGLNIHLLSFSLPKKIVRKMDEIRVSITAMPDGIKQHFHLPGKKMSTTNHVFSLNITNQTRRVIMVFRKKYLFADSSILASTTIHLNDFQNVPVEKITEGCINSEIKTMDIYYPLQKQMSEEKTKEKDIERKVLGKMELQISYSPPYVYFKQDIKSKNNNKNDMKIMKNKKHTIQKEGFLNNEI